LIFVRWLSFCITFHSHGRTLTTGEAVTTEVDSAGYEIASFNFAKLIHRYQRPFAKEDTAEALQYLLLIPLNKDAPEPVGKEQRAICHDYVRELVIDTEKYAELLGDLRIDGVKTVRSIFLTSAFGD
jgi:nuclear pore complex protein Nup93